MTIKNITQKNKPVVATVGSIAVGDMFVGMATGTLYIRRSITVDHDRGGYRCLELRPGSNAQVAHVSANCEVQAVNINIEWEPAG